MNIETINAISLHVVAMEHIEITPEKSATNPETSGSFKFITKFFASWDIMFFN